MHVEAAPEDRHDVVEQHHIRLCRGMDLLRKRAQNQTEPNRTKQNHTKANQSKANTSDR